jgi:hypothetical protein
MKQQQSTLEKRNALEEGQKRGCCGSTELGIVVPRRSWREISLWKTGDRHRKKKRKAGVSFHGPHNHNQLQTCFGQQSTLGRLNFCPKNGEHPNPTHEKLTKFREYLSQSR